MKQRIITVLSCILVTIFLFGCGAKETTQKNIEPEPITVIVPEPCTYGELTIRDPQGNTHFQYEGSIDIINNGRNGEPIDISVTLPGTQGIGADSVYSTPIPIVLYNKNTKTIEQYLAYPKIENGTLKLMDADLTYIERDIEWDGGDE